MTLVELMISIVLFAIIAGSIIAVMTQSRRLAELNIYESTAQTAAQGYLEQLKTMPYGTLGTASLPTLPVAILPNVWNTPPPIDINLTPTTTADDIPFRIRPTITNRAPTYDCYEIVIDYQFDSKIFGSVRTHRGNVRLIRSLVPSF